MTKSQMQDLKNSLLTFVDTATALANSVQEDVKEQRSISDDTVLLLSKFQDRFNDLETTLDVIKGLN